MLLNELLESNELVPPRSKRILFSKGVLLDDLECTLFIWTSNAARGHFLNRVLKVSFCHFIKMCL